MKAPLLVLALAALAGATVMPARAADMKSAPTGASAPAAAASGAAKAPTAQQNRMVSCQRQASEQHLDGTARQAYVTDCLKNKPAASAPTQGRKLGACSKEAAAKGLKGEERNRYLSDCAKSS